MSGSSKVGFVLGMAVAVALTVTLLSVKSSLFDPPVDSVHLEDNDLSDEAAITETQNTQTVETPLGENVLENEPDRSDPVRIPSGSAVDNSQSIDLDLPSADNTNISSALAVANEPPSASGVKPLKQNVTDQGLSLEEPQHDSRSLVFVDRLFGPFASRSRAKRFAAVFSEKTGLHIKMENVVPEGWFITVGFIDEVQRLQQRESLQQSTGLTLLSMESTN